MYCSRWVIRVQSYQSGITGITAGTDIKFRAFSHGQSIPTSFPLSRWRPTRYWFQVTPPNLLISHWIMDIFPNPVSQYEGHNSISSTTFAIIRTQ